MKKIYDRPSTETVCVNTCAVMDEIIEQGSGEGGQDDFEANRSHMSFDDEEGTGKSPIWDD